MSEIAIPTIPPAMVETPLPEPRAVISASSTVLSGEGTARMMIFEDSSALLTPVSRGGSTFSGMGEARTDVPKKRAARRIVFAC